MSELRTLVAAERGALADDVARLTPEQWARPSLCPDWTVRHIVAHLTAAASTSPGAFISQFAAARFNFDRYANAGLARRLGADPGATLAAFRAVQRSTTAPPGPKPTWLGEVVVHSEDIRRPLGISHHYDPEALGKAADFYKGSNVLIGAKKRIEGLRLRATDQDWSHGSGPTVEGPMLSLVMAMTGRGTHVDDLTGEGVETLRSRCT
jgi:uncharacterized protein (TIGR03083 family)